MKFVKKIPKNLPTYFYYYYQLLQTYVLTSNYILRYKKASNKILNINIFDMRISHYVSAIVYSTRIRLISKKNCANASGLLSVWEKKFNKNVDFRL